eukprot:2854425-Rhodomonas_salina.3
MMQTTVDRAGTNAARRRVPPFEGTEHGVQRLRGHRTRCAAPQSATQSGTCAGSTVRNETQEPTISASECEA